MDHMLYVAMAGAKQTLMAQAVNSHNLANASTTGFKAELFQARSMRESVVKKLIRPKASNPARISCSSPLSCTPTVATYCTASPMRKSRSSIS